MILAYARGSDADRKFWAAAMAGSRTSDEDLAEAIRLVGSSGALADTMERARLYARRAIDALAPIPQWSRQSGNGRSRRIRGRAQLLKD